MSLFSKNDDEGGGEGGQKSQKIDDVFYEWPLIRKSHQELSLNIDLAKRNSQCQKPLKPLYNGFQSQITVLTVFNGFLVTHLN